MEALPCLCLVSYRGLHAGSGIGLRLRMLDLRCRHQHVVAVGPGRHVLCRVRQPCADAKLERRFKRTYVEVPVYQHVNVNQLSAPAAFKLIASDNL